MRRGFTLAELLIALAILGVIATFTIPKVLQSQADGRNKSVTLEAAAAFTDAVQTMRLNGKLTTGTTFDQITPYLNYVKNDSLATSQVDNYYNGSPASLDCNSGQWNCLRLHSGGVIYYNPGCKFSGTTTLDAVRFIFDPDGKLTDSTTNGPGKSVPFFVYYNGKVRDAASIESNSRVGWTSAADEINGPWAGTTPPWFNWN